MPDRLEVHEIVLGDDHPLWPLVAEGGIQGSPRGFHVRHRGRLFSVLMTRDNLTAGLVSTPNWRWHLSIAGQDLKVPEWATIAAICHEVRPGIPMVLGIPPKSWWVNIHPGTLHAWETQDQHLIDSWRAERLGMEAS